MSLMFWFSSSDWVDRWMRSSMLARRAERLSTSIQGLTSPRPIPWARVRNDMAPPVAIMALDGMQSQRWAAPPPMSFSIMTTSAPWRAA
jgi:hypothetical protein